MKKKADKKTKVQILKEIGLRLQMARKQLNYRQNDFARLMDISNTNLSEIEAGKIRPGFSLLYNISLKFGVSLEYILHGRGSMFTAYGYKQGRDILVDYKDITGEQWSFLKEFLGYFKRSKVVRYSMMAYFTGFLVSSKKLLELEAGNIPVKNGEESDNDFHQDMDIDSSKDEIKIKEEEP